MEITLMQQIIASSFGGALTALFVTPMDVIKIRMQSQNVKPKCFLYCNGLMDHLCYCLNGNSNGQNVKWYSRPAKFNGTIHGMIHIARTEGIASLWSGLSPTLVMAIPATVIYYTSYDNLRTYLARRADPSLEQYAPVLAGAIARSGTVTVVSPLELIRTKMQSKPLSYKEISAAVRSSVKKSGYRSLWIGLGATMLRDIPFSMLYWYLYERFKEEIDHPSVFVRSFMSGFISGTISSVVTLPLDVVKTRRQITLGELEMKGVAPHNQQTRTWFILKKIVAENGYRGLFAGLLPRVAKVAPGCAIMISCYEVAKSIFKKQNEQRSQSPVIGDAIPLTTAKTDTNSVDLTKSNANS